MGSEFKYNVQYKQYIEINNNNNCPVVFSQLVGWWKTSVSQILQQREVMKSIMFRFCPRTKDI